MGEANAALCSYMNCPDRIRSVLEYYLGEKLPEDWAWEELKGFYPVRNSKGKLTHRQRDSMGKACIGGVSFLLGVENQDRINLIFPWRLMEMDCLAYGQELERIREENLQNGKCYGKEDDFLYRYGKGDRIRPILNLTLYWGKEKWDTPLSLGEMMGDLTKLPMKLRKLAGDYKVHVIHMRRIPEKELQKMDSDLKYVLGLMKRSGSPGKYKAYIRQNSHFFSRIPKSAFDVIDVCTNVGRMREYLMFEVKQEGQEVKADMCKALDEIQKSAERKGMKRGRKQGMEQGIEQGINKMNELVQRLLTDGRQGDLARAAADSVFRKKLFAEYHI